MSNEEAWELMRAEMELMGYHLCRYCDRYTVHPLCARCASTYFTRSQIAVRKTAQQIQEAEDELFLSLMLRAKDG